MKPQLDMLFQLFAVKKAVAYSICNQFNGLWELEAMDSDDNVVFNTEVSEREVGYLLKRLQELSMPVATEAVTVY